MPFRSPHGRTLRAVALLAVATGVAACGGPSRAPSTASAPRSADHALPASSPTHRDVRPRPVSVRAQDPCDLTRRDLTAAISELQIGDFSAWETSWSIGVVDGNAAMTSNPARFRGAMNVVSSMMSHLDPATSAVADAITSDLSDTGGNFENVLSGQGTDQDEASIARFRS